MANLGQFLEGPSSSSSSFPSCYCRSILVVQNEVGRERGGKPGRGRRPFLLLPRHRHRPKTQLCCGARERRGLTTTPVIPALYKTIVSCFGAISKREMSCLRPIFALLSPLQNRVREDPAILFFPCAKTGETLRGESKKELGVERAPSFRRRRRRKLEGESRAGLLLLALGSVARLGSRLPFGRRRRSLGTAAATTGEGERERSSSRGKVGGVPARARYMQDQNYIGGM